MYPVLEQVLPDSDTVAALRRKHYIYHTYYNQIAGSCSFNDNMDLSVVFNLHGLKKVVSVNVIKHFPC